MSRASPYFASARVSNFEQGWLESGRQPEELSRGKGQGNSTEQTRTGNPLWTRGWGRRRENTGPFLLSSLQPKVCG